METQGDSVNEGIGKSTVTLEDVLEALERVLSHAFHNGEVYNGAKADHTTIQRGFHLLSPSADGSPSANE
jgi:hypothetical protein